MSSYQVRDAEERDLEQLLGLYGELAEGDIARMPAGVEVSRVVLAGIINDQSHHLCVAENGNEVVGSVELIVIEVLTHGAMPWAAVENVIVSGEIRGRGAGTALLEHLLNLARARGCYKVQLHSGKQRADAHRPYRGLGFKPVAEGFKLYFDDTRTNLDNEVPERP
jgi:ribosomal protein S18 acetylase RimI-like enzyme